MHLTLAVVVAVHVAVFFVIASGGKPGGSGSASSADGETAKAEVKWQHIDSMMTARGGENPPMAENLEIAPPAAEEVAVEVEIGTAAPSLAQPSPLGVTVPAVGSPTVEVTESDRVGGGVGAMTGAIPVMAAVPVEGVAGNGAGVLTSGTGSGFGGGSHPGFDSGAYDLLITKEFHRAWVQPLGVDTPLRENVAKLAVKIGRDGKVERFSLAHLTGVPELDSSVLAAARSVRKIAPLPESYPGETYEVMINFQLD